MTGGDTSGVDFGSVEPGQQIPTIVDPISYTRVVMNAGATMDHYPGHHDPVFAAEQGHRAIFVNTMHLAGFVDRVVGAWAGPTSRVVRRKLSVVQSIFAGDTMIGTGHVIGVRTDEAYDPPRKLVDLTVEVSNQDHELCCPAEVTVELRD